MNDLFPLIGFALQWARAQKKFADGYYLAIVLGSSILCAWYGDPSLWTGGFAGWVNAVKLQATNILAATQLTSSVAYSWNDIASKFGQQAPAVVPITNSKGAS